MIWVFACFLCVLSLESFLDTPFWESQKLCYACSYASLNFYELWICSSASLISFLARCALVFLDKCSLSSLRFILDLVKISRNYLLLHLNHFERKKEKLCSWSSLIFVWAYEKQHMKISPKVIDIQEGYNKNFHEDHWTK